MVKRTQKDELDDWMSKLRNAEQHRRNKFRQVWQLVLDQYRGHYYPEQTPMAQVAVNVVAGIVNVIIPTIYFQNPELVLSPRRPGTERRVKLTETLLNYYHDELETDTQIKRTILDALIYGVGYIKMGWEVDVERNLSPVVDENTGMALETGDGEPVLEDRHGNIFIEQNGRFVQKLDSKGNHVPPGAGMPTLDRYIKRDQPYAIRWSPWDFVFDPEATQADLSDARWIAFKMVKPLDEVKGHPLLKNTSNLKGTKTVNDELLRVRQKDKAFLDEDLERVELYEIWVKKYNKKTSQWEMHNMVLAPEHDKWLLNRPSPFLAEGFPVATLSLTDDPESANPPSLFSFIQTQIQTINESRSQLIEHRRRFDRRYMFNEEVIDEETISKMLHSGDNAATGVSGVDPDYDLNKALVAVTDAPLIKEVYDDYQIAWDEIQKIIGLSDYQFAGQGPARQATEANFIQGNFNIRIREKQDRVKKTFIHVSKYWKQLFQQLGDFKVYLQVTGDAGQEDWTEFTINETIPDDLDWDADAFASDFQSKEVERADAQALYNLLRNDPAVNPAFLLDRIARAYGIKDPQRMLAPPQPQQPEPIESAEAAGNVVDLNALRAPTPTDPGASGRAASGRG